MDREIAFARLAYDLGRQRATGVLRAGTEEVVIDRGEAVAEASDPLGRRAEAMLERMSVASSPSFSRARFNRDDSAKHVPLIAWLRRQLERRVDRLTVQRFESVRSVVVPTRAPDPALLDPTDRRILAALARPRDLRELAALARAPRFHVAAFLHFMNVVGALAAHEDSLPPPPPVSSAWDILGIPRGADLGLVKAAFRRLARAVHPDLHPGVGEARRRELERRFSHLVDAYASLVAAR